MSICTSYSASSERIVSPPLPMTIPMNSGLIWIVEIRGACSASASRGAVRLERLGDDPDRVREVLRRRQDGLERPLCERAVADVTPLRRAHATGLSDRVGREVVVVHEPAIPLEREVVDPLAFLRRTE